MAKRKPSGFDSWTREEKERYMRLLAKSDPALHRLMSQAGGKRGGPAAAVARKKNKKQREHEEELQRQLNELQMVLNAQGFANEDYERAKQANEHTHPPPSPYGD